MDTPTFIETNGENFLARRGSIRVPVTRLEYPYAGSSHPRTVGPLIVGGLGDIIKEAFECVNTKDTFRGELRKAVDNIRPYVFTSACAYQIGFEGGQSEPTLLVTVRPKTLSVCQAVRLIEAELSVVLERYVLANCDLQP
jgi:hypothetical protein